jgi:large subunit ribosomal protein L7Ae
MRVIRMPRQFYVKFETPKEIADRAFQVLQVAKDSGKIRKGTNETTKAIERGVAKLVLIAEDVEPPQVVAHLPMLCEERKIPYVFVSSKLELGRTAGIEVGSAAITIVEAGEASDAMKGLISAMEKMSKGGATST